MHPAALIGWGFWSSLGGFLSGGVNIFRSFEGTWYRHLQGLISLDRIAHLSPSYRPPPVAPGEVYKLWNFLLCWFFFSLLLLSHSSPNILSNTLIDPEPVSCPGMMNQVSHLCKIVHGIHTVHPSTDAHLLKLWLQFTLKLCGSYMFRSTTIIRELEIEPD